MTYQHFYDPNGDGILKHLLRIREALGEGWTESMADYAISKSSKIPGIKWREARKSGIPYTKITFTEV